MTINFHANPAHALANALRARGEDVDQEGIDREAAHLDQIIVAHMPSVISQITRHTMTKTPAATRIYIVRNADGAPVSLAEAYSQAEALRLHTESLGLSAAPASALDVVRLRDLPVLVRAQADATTQPPDLGDN